MLDETVSLDHLSAELDKSVLDAEEFICRFKDLAARLALADTDDSFQPLKETESLIFSYRDIARRVARRKNRHSWASSRGPDGRFDGQR